MKLYRETSIADQKLIALSALGAVHEEALLQRSLKFALSDEVRPQDIIYVIGSVAANPKGRALAWNFVKEQWSTLYDRYYTGSMSLLGRIVSSTTEDFGSQKWLEEVRQFFSMRMGCVCICICIIPCRRQGVAGHQPFAPTKPREDPDQHQLAQARPRCHCQMGKDHRWVRKKLSIASKQAH